MSVAQFAAFKQTGRVGSSGPGGWRERRALPREGRPQISDHIKVSSIRDTIYQRMRLK